MGKIDRNCEHVGLNFRKQILYAAYLYACAVSSLCLGLRHPSSRALVLRLVIATMLSACVSAIKVKYSLSFRKWKTKMQQNISKFGNHRNWQGGDGRSAIFISSKSSIVNLKSQHVIKYIAATTCILVQKMSCYIAEFQQRQIIFFYDFLHFSFSSVCGETEFLISNVSFLRQYT